MSAGGRLRNLTTRDLEPFCRYVSNNWFKIATHIQLAERWVKDSNECTATRKDENMSNIYAIIRSCTIMCFNDDTRDAHIDRTYKATKF